MAKRTVNAIEYSREHYETIIRNAWSMFGPEHFIDHVGRKWVVNLNGVQEPKTFSTKRRAVAEVQAVVYRIGHKED